VKPVRLGMIVPSSNTVVEQETCASLAGLDFVSAHFARFKLTQISVADPAAAYYDSGVMLEAGKLLADSRCAVITWNGSAGGLVGFERDRRFVAEHGFPAIVSSGGDFVEGELYFIRPDAYARTLARCDELEEIPPGETVGPLYCREQVTVETTEGPHAAWAYVDPRS